MGKRKMRWVGKKRRRAYILGPWQPARRGGGRGVLREGG